MTKHANRYDDRTLAYQYEYTKGEKSNNGDIEYYCAKICNAHESVLEIGCGTGRITIPLKKNSKGSGFCRICIFMGNYLR
jgi:ubiquinone/menaquinone biosynthesis C-methylase UbiE